MISRLVLTTDDSGAGHLKCIRRGTKVLTMQHRLVRDPVPAAEDMSDFFAERGSLYRIDSAQFGAWEYAGEESIAKWFDDFPTCWHDYELIEFWVEPVPNSQLVLIQFLDWLSRRDLALGKLSLVHADGRLGKRTQDEIRSLNPTTVPVGSRHLHVARLAWAAFRHSTPEKWAKLLQDDLAVLPFLGLTVLRMLEELPADDTALGASESRILALAASGEVEAARIFHAFCACEEMLQYWEVGKAMDLLARGSHAAIVGLEDGPFDMNLHESTSGLDRYMRSRLSLSKFGRALVERQDDFSRHVRFCRWWGGTKLTNDNC